MSMLRLDVRVIPRAARDEIAGTRDGALIVRVTAPPVEDAANRVVVKLIAKRAGVARSRVRITRGKRSRAKRIEIDASDEVLARITG
jgi:uncharacterized protein (TIGR00251 family)